VKITVKTIKQWLAFILTLLVVVTLFGIIFIKSEIIQPTPDFFLEVIIVLVLSLLMKLWWYDYTEERRLAEDDIKQEKATYFTMVDKVITDTNEFEKYLVLLNQENREHFIKNKLGSRTPKKLSEVTWWHYLWHPAWKKMTTEDIGNLRYAKLYYRIQRKADKLKPLKSEHIMALSDSEQLYDSRNHLVAKKRMFQFISTIASFMLTIALSVMAMKEIMLNWANVFRYIGYLCAMAWTIAYTVIKAYRQTGDETFDYFSRLKFIVDKYATYKEKEVSNGKSTITS
jgi:cytochrome c biogenesis protein CcdA